MTRSEKPKNLWLQALRAFAAIYVMLFHCIPFWQLLDNHTISSALVTISAHGYFGVDVFFVMSGYVIGMSTANKARSVRNGLLFLHNRLFRIFLGYWPVLCLTILLAYVGIRPVDGLIDKLVSSVFLLSKQLSMNILEVAWSLSYELTFYIAAFFMIFCIKVMSLRVQIMLLMAVLCVYNFYWYLFHRDLIFSGKWLLHYPLSALSIEFLLGFYLANIRVKGLLLMEFIPLYVMVWLGAFTVGTYQIFFVNYELFRVFTFGLSALFLLLTFLTLEANHVKSLSIFTKIGDASYSLYLLHPLILALLGAFLFSQYAFLKDVFILLAPVACITVAILWFYFFEKKCYMYFKRDF